MKITSAADLKTLRTAGDASLYPDRLKITVGMATCGLAAGADAVYEALQQRLEQRGLRQFYRKPVVSAVASRSHWWMCVCRAEGELFIPK
jgi:hypothetical protein